MIPTTATTDYSASSLPSHRPRRKLKHPITRSLTPRENTAIIVALRFFQRAHDVDADPGVDALEARPQRDSTALHTLSISDDEVEALCEYLECDAP